MNRNIWLVNCFYKVKSILIAVNVKYMLFVMKNEPTHLHIQTNLNLRWRYYTVLFRMQHKTTFLSVNNCFYAK